MFGRSAFIYQPEADSYICPAGHALVCKQVMYRIAYRVAIILSGAASGSGPMLVR
jgi:hypothetical protein